MIKHKKFPNIASLTRFLNSQNIPLDQCQVAFQVAEPHLLWEDYSPEIDNDRITAVKGKLETHLNYSRDQQTNLQYPKALIGKKAVPLSRFVNSVKNLVCFKGMKQSEVREFIVDLLDTHRFGEYIPKSQATKEYGVKGAIIVPRK